MKGELGLPDRFWTKVNRDGPINHYRPELGPCWIWTAAATTPPPLGYGRFYRNGNTGLLAHRLTYEAVNGSIPGHLRLDHLCRERLCCRPDHLEAVTSGENIRRGYADREAAGEYVRSDNKAYKLAWQREHAKDAEWRARRAERGRARFRERYENDPEFREKMKAKARAAHARKRGQRLSPGEPCP